MSTKTWKFIAEERLRLAAYGKTLTAKQWRTASLCEGWTVADVYAHLVLESRYKSYEVLPSLIKGRGNIHSMMDTLARKYAKRMSQIELTKLLKEDAKLKLAPAFVSPLEVLIDLVIHSADIKLALGEEWEVSPEIMHHILAEWHPSQLRFGTITNKIRRRMKKLHWTAEDYEWSAGQKGWPNITGSSQFLIFAISGRGHALEYLRGDGVKELRKRLG
jgi:uncharacterized protein (TIGR03083 family)